ncbi:MAG: DUF4338 domain-containing protein [Planctomycetes bacterium]|nr:DUF4338 domain-containing protein [Planctomycetota bacterium]
MSNTQRLPFEPDLPEGSNAAALFLDFARKLAALPGYDSDKERNAAIEVCRRRAIKDKGKCDSPGRQPLLAAMHVLADLAKQGWSVGISGEEIKISREENGAVKGDEARERIRSQLHAERDEQLRQPAATAFIRSMEARQLFEGQCLSVFSLMRDGKELATKLTGIARAPDEEGLRVAAEAISPYLQFIRGEDERCPYTGLRLIDVWRYFRHTWANPYKSVPGRTVMVLVRDAAAPCHPLVGIAALSSAAVAVTARDEKIGWTSDAVVEELMERPTAKLAAWLQRIVDGAIDEIYKVDLFEDEILSARELSRPSADVVARLDKEGRQQRKEHHRFMGSGEYKKSEPANDLGEEHWEAQARSALFRSKRALELANLLSVRRVLRQYFGDPPSKNMLVQFVSSREGRDAVAKIVRKAKADRVGTAIADLTVCGAVPPYNEVLGGKLVAMLMVGPEVVVEYRRRYGGIPSVIASSMAGQPVCRAAELAFIGTTSFYGQRPSQYDRISIPRDPGAANSGPGIRYDYLGRTRGIGTFQFGDQTVSELALLLAQSKRGQQVNSVFGEGVNPRLRKLRDGLDALGLPTDDLLNHGGPRLVYGVELTENTHAYLLGMDKHPKFILPQKGAKQLTQQIARWWMKRWLLPRVAKDGTLERVAQHNFVHPIRHGARVRVPSDDEE